MKIRIKDKYTLTTLNNLKGKYLIDDRGDILFINDFEYEVVTETPPEKKAKSGYFVRKKDKVSGEPKRKAYLTKLEVHGYNADLEFIGVFNDDWCERMIMMQEDNYSHYSLAKMHKKWLRLVEQLEAYGFKLEYPEQEETTPEEKHCTCEDPIVQQGEETEWCTKCNLNIKQ